VFVSCEVRNEFLIYCDHFQEIKPSTRRKTVHCESSGFRRVVVQTFVLPGCYAAEVGSWLRTFRDKVSEPYARVEQTKENYSWTV
jgi:hypothetical protein